MAVTASDIKFYLSGGSSNSSGDASLGGAISSTEIPAYVMDGLMDQVSGKESKAGDTNYRIIYLKNNHATDDALNVEIYFDQDATNKQRNDAGVLISPAVDDPIVYNSEITMALYPGSVNVAAAALADEATAPAGSIVYSSAQGEPNALAIGTIPATQFKAIIIRRVIPANTPAKDINHILVSGIADSKA